MMNQDLRLTHVSNCLETTQINNNDNSNTNFNVVENDVNLRKSAALINIGPPELLEYSPFGVYCPYRGCSKLFEARHLTAHAILVHRDSLQNLNCPVCDIMRENQQPRIVQNLIEHLVNQHPEIPQVYNPEDDIVIPPMDFDDHHYEKMDTSYYDVNILETDLDQECLICFETFIVGDETARLPCFCIYHKFCIDTWFKREKQCPFHMHE